MNILQEASNSSSLTKLLWSPLNASRSNASYASGIFKSEKRRLYVKSSCRQQSPETNCSGKRAFRRIKIGVTERRDKED